MTCLGASMPEVPVSALLRMNESGVRHLCNLHGVVCLLCSGLV